jgi:hypothetical protein
MSDKPDNLSAEKTQRNLLIGLTLGLIAWGAFLGIGAFLGGANLQGSAGRGLVIFGCMSVFLAFWWTLMLTRKRRHPPG